MGDSAVHGGGEAVGVADPGDGAGQGGGEVVDCGPAGRCEAAT